MNSSWPAWVTVRSDAALHFSGALAQNAGEEESLEFKPGMGWIRALRVISDQNLAWEIQFYYSDDFANTVVNADDFCEYHAFSAADGVQVGGSGSYYYAVNGLEIPYQDRDKRGGGGDTGRMHVKLVNRSAAAKNAGATGEIVVEIDAIPVIK